MTTDESPAASPARERDAGSWTLFVLLVVMVAVAAFVIYGLWAWWPSEAPGGKFPARRKTVDFFWLHRRTSRESLFFVTVAFAGALGATVHSLRSLVIYIGTRELRRRWVPFYVVRPVLGAAIATIFYVVLRAGLFSPSSGSQTASPYGFAAVGALAGLFADQAIEKLKKIAEELFDKPSPEWASKDSISTLPLAETGPPENIGSSTATVTGTVNPRGFKTTYYFEYGPTATYGSKTDPTSAGSGQVDVPAKAELTGLMPGTPYHYRVVAQSDAGTSDGDDAQFQTPSA